MASIRREMVVEARSGDIWDAIRDVGAVHTRLAPGFVVDTRLEEGARVVTFGNGLVARELIGGAHRPGHGGHEEDAGGPGRDLTCRRRSGTLAGR
jgi:hypothetical protein